ncbi:MarR family winged helix-turn-helix transcriptional regulator [Tateyamaria pelophila]|uniref:MarR family winged helix-turn-helix transcriptional regulator n=1 Tax=Tateyamaria pelophila TaxID=328415 RepID=UPI001CBBDD77|nr:MarR family transcriptional regulator [Tateyamaria pelophila]
MPDDDSSVLFDVFTEIGIIEQLSRAYLEARLPAGLIAPHFTVLNHLTRVADGRTPIDMARAFQVPKTSMTHTLKGLLAHGLIEIRPNPEDGRSKTVWLTDAGRTLRAQVIAVLMVDFKKLMADFDLGPLQQAKPVLTELRKHLDAARDT